MHIGMAKKIRGISGVPVESNKKLVEIVTKTDISNVLAVKGKLD
jgi:predicted transcriptional regulator